MAYVDFMSPLHKRTARDYVGRVMEADKALCAEKAVQFGQDYWDGERKYGYGGYRYDGRWKPVAQELVKHYGLKPEARILDVGCGKGFLLYELSQLLPKAQVNGIDISDYAVANAKPEVAPRLKVGQAQNLPYEDKSFDFVFSLMTLHNLPIYDLWRALQEIERVSRGARYISVESYRNEREKVNLLYWQLTCRAFHAPQEWEWIFERAGYRGDYSFLYFE